MDFEKKLKQRFYLAICYIVIGIAMIVFCKVSDSVNDFISAFGIALTVCGIVRLRRYFSITKDDESIRKQKVSETDERNVSIILKAKSAAFSVYILIVGTAVIVLQCIDKQEISKCFSYSVCLLVFIYYLAYHIIKKRS